MDQKGHMIDQKGLKMYEKSQKMEFSDLKYLLFSGIFISGIGGYPLPPLTENHPVFSAVQDSSILGDLITHSVSQWVSFFRALQSCHRSMRPFWPLVSRMRRHGMANMRRDKDKDDRATWWRLIWLSPSPALKSRWTGGQVAVKKFFREFKSNSRWWDWLGSR